MEPKDSCPMCSRCDVGAKICWILDAFIWDDEPWLYILHFFETCRMQLVFQYVMVELDETRGWSKKTTSLNSYPQKKQMSFVRTDLIWFAARFLAQLRPLIVLSWELQTQKTSRHLNHPKNARWVPALLPDPDNGMSSISTATRICKSINLLTLVDSYWLYVHHFLCHGHRHIASHSSSVHQQLHCRRFGTKGFDSAAVQYGSQWKPPLTLDAPSMLLRLYCLCPEPRFQCTVL